jgi:spore maturation protein CgeB
MNSASSGSILIVGTTWHGNFSRFLFSSMQGMDIPCRHFSTRYEQRPNRILNALQYRFFVNRLNAALLRELESAAIDRIILIAPYNILPGTWQKIKAKKISVIGWFGDNPFTKGIIFDSLQYCDRVYLVDEAWVDRVQYLHPRVAYLPHAADEETFYPVEQDKTYTMDVVFIGDSFNGTKDGLLRARIIKILADTRIKTAVYGDPGWRALLADVPGLQHSVTCATVSPEEVNRIYNTAKIVLNIHHSQLTAGTNQRTFEIAAAGAFQLADFRPAISALYQDCSVTYSSAEDLLQKARYYLTHGPEREQLACQARARTLEHNTYKHRIKTLISAW